MVVGQIGQSLDGRIATETGHSKYINGPAGLAHLHRLRALVDAQPDRTLAELREALHSAASVSSVWRAVLSRERFRPNSTSSATNDTVSSSGCQGNGGP